MAAKKKKAGWWKKPKARKKVHKLAAKVGKQIGKTVKGSKARKQQIFHGIAYGKITGRKPQGGVRKLKGKKGSTKPKRRRL